MKGKRLVSLAVFAMLTMTSTTVVAAGPKYVFFFVGDGMSSAQIQAAEAYLTTKNGGSATKASDLQKSENRLNMSKFPVLGMQTTYDAHALITDSASAGTALACGSKTQSGVIGMDDSKTIRYKSIAQLAHEQGKKVGIISSVSLDHATPAAFYASVPNRGLMNNIATQMAATDYEFFGGGGLVYPTSAKPKTDDTANNVWDLLAKNQYTVRNTRDGIMALKSKPQKKVVCINPYLQDSQAMPYAIDRPASNVSLVEMTEVAIATLSATDNATNNDTPPSLRHDDGFFLMVEGGKIDWACHANDAMAAIGDTLALDEAIGAALDFYRKYPKETLIVVTGDHETGGMTIGHATTGYGAYYDRLLNQTESFTDFAKNQWTSYKSTHSAGYDYAANDNLATSSEMIALIKKAFGLDYTELNEYQKERLEDAFDKSMCDMNNNSDDKNKLLYGKYEPIIVTITHILNEGASIGWTSYAHTGVPVPVFAIGSDAQRFSGFYDNTDIAKQLAGSMGIKQTLPVQKND